MSAPSEAQKKLVAKFFANAKKKPASKPASASTSQTTRDDSGWDTTSYPVLSKEELEARDKERKLIAAVKARLLEIWREAYTANKKDYARTVALLEVPEATKLPKGYRITREDTDTYLILKVYTPEGELLHLSIPKPGAPAQFGPHFTQGTYHEDVKLEGGRKTRRLRSKQKRTRRIIRRLVRA